MGGLEHLVVIAVHRNIGVHVAVPRVHMQRDPDPAFQHALVDADTFTQDGVERNTGEDASQRRKKLGLPARAQAVVLQVGKQLLDPVQPVLPLCPHIAQQFQRLHHTVPQHLCRADGHGVILAPDWQIRTRKKQFQFVAQLQLVAQTQFNIDALDAVRVFGHARQRDHHVFIDLEGVGVARDGRRAFAVQPELLARLGADRNKPFAATAIRQPHDLRTRMGDLVGIVARNVADQHHLRQTRALGCRTA